MSIDTVKTGTFTGHFMWLKNPIFKKHLAERKLWCKLSLLKYTWKSLFSGINIRKLSRKRLKPNQVIISGANPRYSELPFLFLSAEINYFKLDTSGKPSLHDLNTTVSHSPLDIFIFCLWFCFVILSIARRIWIYTGWCLPFLCFAASSSEYWNLTILTSQSVYFEH